MNQEILNKIYQIKEFIDENICSINSVKDLTQHFNINKNILHDYFKTIFKNSPKEYIIEKKIEALEKIILTTEDDNIVFFYAYSLGFSSSATLCNLIKRKTGLTFQEFKKRVLEM